jgi:hypothetical protein
VDDLHLYVNRQRLPSPGLCTNRPRLIPLSHLFENPTDPGGACQQTRNKHLHLSQQTRERALQSQKSTLSLEQSTCVGGAKSDHCPRSSQLVDVQLSQSGQSV